MLATNSFVWRTFRFDLWAMGPSVSPSGREVPRYTLAISSEKNRAEVRTFGRRKGETYAEALIAALEDAGSLDQEPHEDTPYARDLSRALRKVGLTEEDRLHLLCFLRAWRGALP